MNVQRFVLAGLAGGVVGNVLDFVVHGQILQSRYYSQNPALFKADTPMYWYPIMGFLAALVLTWVWDRVGGSFGTGAKAGATGGLYAGVLMNFPAMIGMHLGFVGFPYALSWIWMIYGILWYVVVGAVIGALYKK